MTSFLRCLLGVKLLLRLYRHQPFYGRVGGVKAYALTRPLRGLSFGEIVSVTTSDGNLDLS